MPGHDIICVGASAGGVEALKRLVERLPAEMAASLFVVMHVAPQSPSLMPAILQKVGKLRVMNTVDKARFERGCIYMAPPDWHLLLERERIRVVRGPKENRHRPAIDPLFRSAAWAHGPRVVGVVLSGMLDDGASGLWAIKSCGGVTVVQDPADAAFDGMPIAALRATEIDHCLSLDQIPPLLINLAKTPPARDPTPTPPAKLKIETEFAMLERDVQDMNQLGQPTAFTCPSCRGALWELQEGDQLRYRCHTGHAFSSKTLLADQTEAVEQALYDALRAVQEKAASTRRLAERVGKSARAAEEYHSIAEELDKSAAVLAGLLAKKKEK